MGKEQRKKSPRPMIGNMNSYLMERDRGRDVEVQRTKQIQSNNRRAK